MVSVVGPVHLATLGMAPGRVAGRSVVLTSPATLESDARMSEEASAVGLVPKDMLVSGRRIENKTPLK